MTEILSWQRVGREDSMGFYFDVVPDTVMILVVVVRCRE